MSTILPITLGTTASSSLPLGQRVRYSVDLNFDQTLRIILDGQTLRDAYLRVYDNRGRIVAFDDDSGGNFDSLIQRSFKAGSYSIEVAGYADRYQGSYALSLTSLTPAVNGLSSSIGTNTGLTPTIQSTGLTRDNTALLSGTRTVDTTVAIYDGETLLSSSANGGAAWLFEGTNWRFVTAALPDGLRTLTARFIAPDSSFTTQSVTLTVDTAAIGSLAPSILTDSGANGSIFNGGTTTDSTLGLTGTAEAGSTVQIYDGTRLLGNALLTANTWAYTTPSLSLGSHNLSVRVTDLAGNTWVSSNLSVAVTAPAAQLLEVGQTVTNSLTLGQRIKYSLVLDSQQNLSIFLDGTTLYDSYLRIYDSKQRLIAFNDDGGGNLDSKIERVFAAGSYTVEAAGYADRQSGNFALSVTAKDPSMGINMLSNTLGTNSGLTPTIQSGGQTKDNTVTLTGTYASGSAIAIYDGQTLLASSTDQGPAWQLSGTTWSYTTSALSDGPHTLEARFTAQGTSTVSKKVTLSVDTVASGSLSDTITTNTGSTPTIVGGGTTTDDTLLLTGNAEVGSIVQIYDGTTLLGTAALTAGNWTFTTPSLGLGAHALSARVTDTVGNTFNTASKVVTITAPGPAPEPTPSGDFSIELAFQGETSAYQTYFEQAAARWTSVIVGDLPDINGVDDLKITVVLGDADLVVGAEGYPTSFRGGSFNPGLPYEAEIVLNSAEIPALIANGTFLNLITREMGIALGFGSQFESEGLVEPSNLAQYVGANALAQYGQLTGTTPAYIPIEPLDEVFTYGRHWTEDVFGNELMTKKVNANTLQPLSNLTIGAMADLGYTVAYPSASAYSFAGSGATANVRVAENTLASIPVYVPSDAGLVLSYAIVPGADAGKFNIDPSTGTVTFKAAPDFETPLSSLLTNNYTFQVRANYSNTFSVNRTVNVRVTDVNEVAPTSGLAFSSATANPNVSENLAVASVAYQAQATGSVAATSYSLSGPDAALFTVNNSGQVFFRAIPNYELPTDAGRDNTYNFTLTAEGAGGATASQQVALSVADVAAPATTQAFALWQDAELAAQGDATKNIQAYNQFSQEVGQERDNTSRDGRANQLFETGRLMQWVDRVTGTDIVSDAEFDTGFTVTGKAAAGAQSTIKFRLDKDRTTGADGEGAAVITLGANDLNRDSTTDVTASYDDSSGEWSLAFAPGSAALFQARADVAGSGVHQLVVDTNGNGIKGSVEASRLFLVASGTASNTDTGTVAQNYSVQDRLTKDVFVYYYGDPDGAGVGMITRLDNGDTLATDDNSEDKDGNGLDRDYYTTAEARSALPAATAANTAMHFVTDIAAQTWEFHMAQFGAGVPTSERNFSNGNALAARHSLMNSNTSRLASLEEALALYAANFLHSSSSTNAALAGVVEPMSNSSSNNGTAENNRPNGWVGLNWTAAPTPSGHAAIDFINGEIRDWSNTATASVFAVL